jgi:hypothetical protein
VEWRNSISLIMSKYLVEHNHQKALKCIPGLHGLGMCVGSKHEGFKNLKLSSIHILYGVNG